jgi:hypothetical protein
MKFLHDGQDVPIIRPPGAMLPAMPENNPGAIAGHVVKPAENAGSTQFAAEMVLGEGRIICWEIAGVLRVGMGLLPVKSSKNKRETYVPCCKICVRRGSSSIQAAT